MTAGAPSYEHWEPHDGQSALRNQITRTRADLGDTITELAARTDVKARARQAVAQARSRARDAMQSKAQFATMRTWSAAQSGVSSARHALDRLARSPASVVVAGGVGALAGLGGYALLRRRLPLRLAGMMPMRRLRRTLMRRGTMMPRGTMMRRGTMMPRGTSRSGRRR